jgi:hypothetical protein
LEKESDLLSFLENPGGTLSASAGGAMVGGAGAVSAGGGPVDASAIIIIIGSLVESKLSDYTDQCRCAYRTRAAQASGTGAERLLVVPLAAADSLKKSQRTPPI